MMFKDPQKKGMLNHLAFLSKNPSSMTNKIKCTFDLDLDREGTRPGKNKSTFVMPKDYQTWAQRELVVLCLLLL